MDEENLKLSIDTYKMQLDQINSAIQVQGTGPDVQELLQLKEDLTQLVNLTEESLLSLQKSNLLSTIDETCVPKQQSNGKSAKMDDELRSFYLDLNTSERNSDEIENDAERDPVDDEMAKFYMELDTESSNNTNLNAEDKLRTAEPSNGSYLPTDVPLCSKTLANDDFLKMSCSENSLPRNVSSQSLSSLTPSEVDPLNEEFLDSIEDMDNISGVKCQAPFSTDWTGTQYHYAMIKGPLEEDMKNKDDPAEDIKLRVLFLNPVLQSMQPCPYYLEGNCKFEEDKCRFSHGHIISLFELRPFIEPDYSSLDEGAECLAKFQDGVWKPAVIKEVKEDHRYDVKFLHKNVVLTLDLQDILPKTSSPRDSEADSSSDSDEDVVAEIQTNGLYSSYGAHSSSGVPPSLGLWEEHTTGIGSKLMQKMGYQLGQGLGKKSQGRLEPVPIILLPPGKSLDHCMLLKEKKRIKHLNDSKPKNKHANQEYKGGHHRRRRETCVFSFLNKTLGDKNTMKKSGELQGKRSKDLFGIKEGKEMKTTKRYNKALFHNDEEMRKVEMKVRRLKESIKRNETRNPSVAKALRAKLNDLKGTLNGMEQYSSKMKLQHSRMETHRKMTTF